MRNNLKSATEYFSHRGHRGHRDIKNINPRVAKLTGSFVILSALALFSFYSAPALGCGNCNPPCGPCQTCQGGVCVNLCNPVTQICVNGECVDKFQITYTYDEVGNRITMTDPKGTTNYTYDYLNRLTNVTNPDNKTISYEYDASGNRTKLTDPAGNITTYTYDGDNRPTGVTAPAGVTTYQYDSLGRQTRADLPNGTYTEYSYNSQRNWLVSLVNKNSSDTVLSSYTYTYDNVGNRLSVTENDGSAVSYGYDDIYQLTSETRTGANPYTSTYQYDNVGNRTQMVKNAVTTSYTYNNKNQLLTEIGAGTTTTYAYDRNGNLTSKTGGGSTTTYTWNWQNRLLSVSSAESVIYEYDGDGTRISKTQAGVKTKYINDVAFSLVQVLMETDNSGAVQAIYNYGSDLISMNRAGVNSYYNYDGLGSTRQLTNGSEAVAASYTYDGYGNLIASSGTVANTYGYTGEQQFVEADGLVFLRARYYKPNVGRFLSSDPMGYGDGMNSYIYVNNNPVMQVDPEGLCGSFSFFQVSKIISIKYKSLRIFGCKGAELYAGGFIKNMIETPHSYNNTSGCGDCESCLILYSKNTSFSFPYGIVLDVNINIFSEPHVELFPKNPGCRISIIFSTYVNIKVDVGICVPAG